MARNNHFRVFSRKANLAIDPPVRYLTRLERDHLISIGAAQKINGRGDVQYLGRHPDDRVTRSPITGFFDASRIDNKRHWATINQTPGPRSKSRRIGPGVPQKAMVL